VLQRQADLQQKYLTKINSEREQIKLNKARIFKVKEKVFNTEKKSRHFLNEYLEDLRDGDPKAFSKLINDARSRRLVDG
jgi:hypothetical protein